LQRHESALLCRFLRHTVTALVASERALIADLRRRNETLVVTLHSLQHMQSQLVTANDLVRTDELTGLTNRRGLYQYLDASGAVARRSSAELGLLLFDLDDFKSINDRCGHHSGDDALRAIAAAVSALAAPGDLLCRLGGDEFALLVHIAHRDELELLSARVVSVVRALPAPCPGTRLSVSVGASLCRHGTSWSTWYRDADEALYAAKHDGGNGWRIARQPG
jgi:diguanylate cyclase (GGDEF)-like protein